MNNNKRERTDEVETSEVISKKMKQSLTGVVEPKSTLLSLNADELSTVLPYLYNGEVLMLAMTCKTVNTVVSSIIKSQSPYPYEDGELWRITEALSRKQEYGDVDETLIDLLTENPTIELCQITDCMSVTDYTGAVKLLSIERAGSRKIEVIHINWKDDSVKTSLKRKELNHDVTSVKIMEEVNNKVGFSLKNLELEFHNCSRMELYGILSNCYALESLALNVEEGFNGGDGPSDDHPAVFKIPVLNSLKKLTVNAGYCYETSNELVIDLLSLAPNLEEFDFIYPNEVDDEMLKCIAKNCPNLKKLYVQGNDGSTPMENYFTDSGILQLLKDVPSLTHLELYHCLYVSGRVFTKIGQYGSNLKTLFIQRIAFNGDICDQYDNVHFGGGELPSLERLVLDGSYENLPDNFSESIVRTAPNLQHLVLRIGEMETEKMVEILSGCHHLRSVVIPPSKELIEALLNKSTLESITIENRYSAVECCITLDHLKACTWPNLKHLQAINIFLPENSDEWLLALLKACPNLEKFVYDDPAQFNNSDCAIRRGVFGKALMQILKDTSNWPKLRVLNTGGLSDEGKRYKGVDPSIDLSGIKTKDVRACRPLVITESLYDVEYLHRYSLKKQKELSIEDFVRQWILLDPFLKEEGSERKEPRH